MPLAFRLGTLCVLTLLMSCSSGKHVFILSGQSNMVLLDPSSSFTPKVEEVFGPEHVLIVKHAQGGQPIHRWYKNWNYDSAIAEEPIGDLYDSLLVRVKDSIQGHKIKSATFIWMQGERDARQAWGEVYEESLLGVYEQLKEDLQLKTLRLVIGRLSDFDLNNERYPHWTLVREAQMKIGDSSPYFVWVNTDDLNDGLNRQGKTIKNDLHMSEEGYILLGKRFAEAAIVLIR